MKRLLPLAALLCLLAACAAPEAQETSASLPEPAPVVPECRETANEVISPDAETALRALLAEAASQSERRATAGDSMRLCALAGMLLDWQREADPAPSAAEAAARSYASELDVQTRKALENRLGALRAAASELCAGNTGAMEDGGYVPRCTRWEASAAEAFFAALLRGVKSEYSDDGSGKSEYFSAFAIAGSEKVCYDTDKLKIYAHPLEAAAAHEDTDVRILDRIQNAADIRACSLTELDTLCAELREELIRSVSKTGGHLASNLGVVELTVALHNVYDPEKDRILFDVGHQCYVHKMLTGRLAEFDTLRQDGGLSGFPKPEESETDAFIAGHASNAVSVALGMARARTVLGADYDVAAVLGDGALTGGLAYEGLNNAGQSREPMVIILNDNGVAINSTVGAMAKYLTRQRLRPGYYRMKRFYRRTMMKLPGGKAVFRVTQRWKNQLKNAFYSCTMFEEMGFRYLGPVDGHNVKQLSYMLKVAREYRQPVLLHVVTRKGKGYPDAEAHPELYHGVAPFDPAKGVSREVKPCFSSVFGEAVSELAANDRRICVITAAMEDGTGLRGFHKAFPERFFDEGIAEGHAVTMAAGMAKQGLKPVFAVYSTFLQRSYDMLLHDVALLQLPVVLAVDRCGLVGADGETHNGVFDVGYLRQVPGMRIYSPASYRELRDMLAAALGSGVPCAVRYPRGGEGSYRDGGADPLRVLREGRDVCIVSYGILINEALSAAEALEKAGVHAKIVKLGVLAPLDFAALEDAVADSGAVIVAEEAMAAGCIGETLAAHFREKTVVCLNLGERFLKQGTVAEQRRRGGIDAAAIVDAARRLLK